MGTSFLVLGLTNPHLLECSQRSQDRASAFAVVRGTLLKSAADPNHTLERRSEGDCDASTLVLNACQQRAVSPAADTT